jgi:hypothetical protein
MPLFFFPLLFMVPFFVMAMILFFVGAFVLRMLFFVAIAAFAGAFLFGSGLVGGMARALGFGVRRAYWRYQNRQFDGPPRRRDPDNSAFDGYRRATLNKLDDEAREFRAFLAKLRQAADAADFQAFLNSRRAGS